MPLPKVNSNESEKEFVSRCVTDSVMNREFPDNKKRIAVCYNIYKRKKKENRGEKVNWTTLNDSGFLIY